MQILDWKMNEKLSKKNCKEVIKDIMNVAHIPTSDLKLYTLFNYYHVYGMFFF